MLMMAVGVALIIDSRQLDYLLLHIRVKQRILVRDVGNNWLLLILLFPVEVATAEPFFRAFQRGVRADYQLIEEAGDNSSQNRAHKVNLQ